MRTWTIASNGESDPVWMFFLLCGTDWIWLRCKQRKTHGFNTLRPVLDLSPTWKCAFARVTKQKNTDIPLLMQVICHFKNHWKPLGPWQLTWTQSCIVLDYTTLSDPPLLIPGSKITIPKISSPLPHLHIPPNWCISYHCSLCPGCTDGSVLFLCV